MHNRFILHPSHLVFALLFAIVLPVSTVAQAWVWTRGAGGPRNEHVGGLGLDSVASSYVVGTYAGRIVFDGTTFSNGQDTGFFIAKYNSFGAQQWAAQGNGSGAFHNACITVDRAGNCWVAGSFARTVNLGNQQLVSQGGEDIFIARYDYYGILRWASRIGGAGDDYARAVSVDANGNMVIVGSFTGSATIGGATLISAGAEDLFVAKYDTGGAPLWGLRGGGAAGDVAMGVAVAPSGDIYVAGAFHGSATLGGTTVEANGTEQDILLASVEAEGTPRWAVRFGAAGDDAASGVAVDPAGNCYLTGWFSGTVQFGGVTLTSNGATDVFAAKVEPGNAVRWAVRGGSGQDDKGYAIAVNAAGNAFVTGMYRSAANFGGGGQLSSNGGSDVLVARVSAAGEFVSAHNAGGVRDDAGYGVAVDTAGEVYVAGTIDSAGFFGLTPFSTQGGTDLFVGRFGAPATVVTSAIVGSPFCSGSAVSVSFTTSGVYAPGNLFTAQLSDSSGSFANPVELGSLVGTEGSTIGGTIPNSVITGKHYRIRVVSNSPPVQGSNNGEDLVIFGTLHPVITPEGTAKLCSGQSVTLDAGPGYASYQWSNGAVTRTIQVTEQGSYNVNVTNDAGCVGLSDPVQVVTVQSPAKPTIIRNGTLLQSSPGDVYQWYRNDQPIPGANDRNFTVTEPGIYTVRVFNTDGCGTASDPEVFVAGVPGTRPLSGVTITPNPVSESPLLQFPLLSRMRVSGELFDAVGALVAQFSEDAEAGTYQHRLVMQGLPAGRYFLYLEAGPMVWVGSVVKQ